MPIFVYPTIGDGLSVVAETQEEADARVAALRGLVPPVPVPAQAEAGE